MRWTLATIRAALALTLAASLSACGTLGYYSQAVFGHLDLVQRRVPIEEVIKDNGAPAALKEKLRLVAEVRDFASRELRLPDNDSYRSYADLQRRYVVWNVFATPALSLEPVQSCYLFVGCLSYRGYFSESSARDFAGTLVANGHDVYVGGVAAYSTLGWFADPVLNTMLYWDERRIARVIFHELTHQLLYVRDDALFNESFATSFADIGVRRWISANDEAGLSGFDEDMKREREFMALLLEARGDLESVFTSGLPEQDKLTGKKQAYTKLFERYEAFKRRWHGYADYDEWMNNDLNNAKIASVVTYYSYEKAFDRILTEADRDISRFIQRVRQIAALDESQRHQCLTEYNDEIDTPCRTLR